MYYNMSCSCKSQYTIPYCLPLELHGPSHSWLTPMAEIGPGSPYSRLNKPQ